MLRLYELYSKRDHRDKFSSWVYLNRELWRGNPTQERRSTVLPKVMRKVLTTFFCLAASTVSAQTFTGVPFTFSYGSSANASQVMANFQTIINNGNSVSNTLNNAIQAVTPPPSGSMLFFNLGSCPSGWHGGPGGGWYARGLDQGRGVDTTGTGLGGNEATTLQDHAHNTTTTATSYSTTGVANGTPNFWYGYTGLPGANTNQTTNGPASGSYGMDNRPKTATLLVCIKN